MNQISLLRDKFANEIKLYGIRSVKTVAGTIEIDSEIRLPYELFASIQQEVLYTTSSTARLGEVVSSDIEKGGDK